MFDCNSLANINLSRVYIFSRKWVNITQIALNACTQFIDSIRVLVRIIEKKTTGQILWHFSINHSVFIICQKVGSTSQ